jgi:hypothetical protein
VSDVTDPENEAQTALTQSLRNLTEMQKTEDERKSKQIAHATSISTKVIACVYSSG